MAKYQTNEQMFRKFLKDADTIIIGLTRGAMVTQAEAILKDEAAVREQYKDSIIHPDLIIRQAQEVIKYFGFDN